VSNRIAVRIDVRCALLGAIGWLSIALATGDVT
jgi:hypothetical protein